MTLRCVGTDDVACVAPGRLRHSWLDNQVLLVLRPASVEKLVPGQLAALVAAWRDEGTDLLHYARAFPDVVDPGAFLRQFSERKSAVANVGLCADLSAKFEAAFRLDVGLSVGDFRQRLLAAAEQLSTALDDLADDLRQRADASSLSMRDPKLSATLESAKRVHELLGAAPRGVCLV